MIINDRIFTGRRVYFDNIVLAPIKTITTFQIIMTVKIFFISFILTIFSSIVFGQQPKWTQKHFVSFFDTSAFKITNPENDGLLRTYILTQPQIVDIDDDSTTYIKGSVTALLCFEGQKINHKRNGIFNVYLIDSTDHSKRYKIWQQEYLNDKLNGKWKVFTLHGTIAGYQTFKNDSLNGPAIDYWIDGKSITEERIYFNGKSKYIQKDYFENGKVEDETTYTNDIPNGLTKEYYSTGILKREVVLENGIQNGMFKYYYPSGKIWIEEEMKNGLTWSVIANYMQNGKIRNAGTLKDGDGTIIFYNDDGSIRETATYKNGIKIDK